MTAREEFEAWLLSRKECGPTLIFAAWQASRAAALEEAAKECDGKASAYDLDFEPRMNIAAERCAMAIRALKESR